MSSSVNLAMASPPSPSSPSTSPSTSPSAPPAARNQLVANAAGDDEGGRSLVPPSGRRRAPVRPPPVRIGWASPTLRARHRSSGQPLSPRPSALDGLEALGEPAGVALLGTRQRLEPLGDLGEALVAGGLRETGIHLGVLVGLA